LRWREHLELAVLPHHAHFDIAVVHLSFEALLQSHQRSVDRVLDLHVRLVALLQENLGVLGVFANSSGLPVVVGARGVDLGQMRAALIVSRDED